MLNRWPKWRKMPHRSPQTLHILLQMNQLDIYVLLYRPYTGLRSKNNFGSISGFDGLVWRRSWLINRDFSS